MVTIFCGRHEAWLLTHVLYKQAPPRTFLFANRDLVAGMGKEQQLLEAAAAGNISKVEVSDRTPIKISDCAHSPMQPVGACSDGCARDISIGILFSALYRYMRQE